jgi:hypothetical protein
MAINGRRHLPLTETPRLPQEQPQMEIRGIPQLTLTRTDLRRLKGLIRGASISARRAIREGIATKFSMNLGSRLAIC